MFNVIDKAIELVSPESALRRETARWILKNQRAYEAAQPSRLRKIKADPGSGDAIVERAGNRCACKPGIWMRTTTWHAAC